MWKRSERKRGYAEEWHEQTRRRGKEREYAKKTTNLKGVVVQDGNDMITQTEFRFEFEREGEECDS